MKQHDKCFNGKFFNRSACLSNRQTWSSPVKAIDEKRIERKLIQCVSNNINTAYIKRSNGTLRQMNANLCAGKV
jgi:hypothetical protein